MTEATSSVDEPVEPAGDEASVPTDTDGSVGQEPTSPPPEPDATASEAAAEDTEQTPDWVLLAADDIRSRGELLAELTEAEARRDEYLDGLQRARAEFDNFRKRTLREGAQQRTLGQADVVTRLLDVLDDFERTMEAIADADAGMVTGVGLVRDKLGKTLADVGLERIDQTDIAFDPTQHEAVQQRSADTPSGPTVVEVFRTGYRLGDRVLRPAMVVVEQ